MIARSPMQQIRAIVLLATLAVLAVLVGACEQVGGVDFGNVHLKSETTTGPGGETTPASVVIACGKACADYGFECGGQFDPCGKAIDCGACADGKACSNAGKCGCQPKSCADLGAQCGTASDGCGGVLDCGKCANPAEGCSDNKCKCQPKGCAEQNIHCGTTPDGCGGQYDCQACDGASATPYCSGGTCGAAPCAAKTCAEQGKNCGQISNGCGVIIDCGNPCTGAETCSGGGVANVCGCSPTTCTIQGKNCGSIPNGCGGTLDCGGCSGTGASCGGAGTANVCGCTSNGSCSTTCGTGVDNCGTACTRSTGCGGGGGGGGCFGRGTPVQMADGSFKAIELVEPGERVASYDPSTGITQAALVLARLAHGPETSAAGFLVRHTAAGTLRVTPNHPILIDGVRARADTLRVGSRVYRPFVKSTPASLGTHVLDIGVRSEFVDTLEHQVGNGEPTFDLAIEGQGAFFAANVLVLAKQIEDSR